MKKLITLSVLFAFASAFFISCKSSSVMKRRYNKGFYVHHAAKHSEPKAGEKTAANKPVFYKPAETVQQAPAAPEVRSTASVRKPETKPAVVTAEAEHKQAAKENVKASAPVNIKVLPTAFSHKKQLQLIKDLKVKARSGYVGDEALSLLWILILVLLIIYLLGFALDDYGIGAAIHVLALVIVILLILWLLRIL